MRPVSQSWSQLSPYYARLISWLVGKGPSAWSAKDCVQEHGLAHPISPGIRPIRSRFIAATLIFTQASTFARPRQGTLAVRDFS